MSEDDITLWIPAWEIELSVFWTPEKIWENLKKSGAQISSVKIELQKF